MTKNKPISRLCSTFLNFNVSNSHVFAFLIFEMKSVARKNGETRRKKRLTNAKKGHIISNTMKNHMGEESVWVVLFLPYRIRVSKGNFLTIDWQFAQISTNGVPIPERNALR